MTANQDAGSSSPVVGDDCCFVESPLANRPSVKLKHDLMSLPTSSVCDITYEQVKIFNHQLLAILIICKSCVS